MHASGRHRGFTTLLKLGALAALLITGALFASQAMAEQASSDVRELQSGRLDAGDAHTCAIYGSGITGDVRCWGDGGNGRLGYGNTNTIGDNEAVSTAGPVNLGTGRTAKAVAAGSAHTCALLDNGTVRCWGNATNGELGYGNTTAIGDDETPNTAGPVFLGFGRTAVAITAGDKHTCALLDNGTVRCWGDGGSGRLGYGNTSNIGDDEVPGFAGPVNLGVGRTAVAISAGWEHTCAILDNGNVLCWGKGGQGRLGYGNQDDIGNDEAPGSVGPVNIGAGRTAVAIAAGGIGGATSASTCVLMDDGNVRCWGEAASGRLGYGNTTDIGDNETPDTVGPVNLGTGRTAKAITVGAVHACAVLDNDTLRCWGEGDAGRLGYGNQSDIGDNETPNAAGPVNLGAGRTAITVTAGTQHTCALLDNGSVRCWGDGDHGRTGNGNTVDIGDTETPDTAGPVGLGGTVNTAGPPPVANDDSATVNEDAAASSVNVLANDTTSEGWTTSITSVTQPSNGSVVITGGGTGLTYQPNSNYCNGGSPTDNFTYTITGGDTATVAMTVTCVDDNPVAVDDSATVSEDASATAVSVLTNDTDVDGGPKTISAASDPSNGTVVLTGGSPGAHTGLTYQPDPNYCNNPPGTLDTFTYTITGGSTATVSMTVTCVDDNPVAVNDSATVNEDASATAISVLTNDTDVDGGPKTISSASNPANGSVVLTGGSPGAHTGLTYQPDPDYCNNGTPTDNFTYTLNGGSQATVSMTVTCVEDNPVAVNDSATVNEDAGATAISVLANDTDADGGQKTISSASDPANGTVVLTGGSPGAHTGLTYQPDPNYCNNPPGGSPDTFTYTLNGGSVGAVAVTVNCVDDLPTAVDDAATVNEDAAATTINVLANDPDPDGGTKLITSVTSAANGSVAIAGGGTGVTYQPDPNYCNDPPGGSPDTFTYTITGGSTATVSVTVTCVDDLPTAVDDSDTVAKDAPATPIDVLGNDTDPDDGPMSIQSTSDPANGTVVITGGGSGLTYQPDAGYCNDGGPTDDFTYTLNGGSAATVEMSVSCTDDPPTAVDDLATVAEDDPATAIDVLANDPDPDGGPKQIQSATQPAGGTVVITGGGSGLTYEPDPGFCNDGTPTDNFTYTLNGGSTATVAVTVTCVDQPPTAVDDSATVDEDVSPTAVNVLANDTDIDGGPKTISSATDPANGTVTLTGGSPGAHTGLRYQPDPDYCNDGTPTDNFTYALNGGSEATVSMTVTCVDELPTAVDDSATVTEDDATTAIDVLVNDTDPDGGPKQVNSTTQPANGTVVITGGGTGLTYEPDPDYCNDGTPTDNFTYTLNGGSEATVSMTVTCVEDDPQAVDDSATVAEDSGATAIEVLANDPDPDGGTKQIQSVTQPANGTVVITGGGAGLTYQPDPGYCNNGFSTDDFTYTLNGGSEATVSVTVTCDNVPPTAVDDTPTVTEDDGVTPLDVLANDTDPDGGLKLIQSVTQPNRGTVVITGGGTGLTYQPDPDFCNNGIDPDDFTYTLNGGSTATVDVTITCVDDDPVAVADAATVNENSGVSAVDVLANDSDPDAGPPTLIQSTTQPANGTVVITGGGTGLTYEPATGYCNSGGSTDDFTYTLNGGSTATVSVAVVCEGDVIGPSNPPTANPPSVTVPPGQQLTVHKLVVPRSVGKLARKGVKLLVTCKLDCQVVVKVSVTTAVMTQMGLRKPQIASGAISATAGQEAWVTAKLTKRARAAMRRYGGGGRLNVDVRALDPS